LITVALSATIGAPPERVWRALIDPSERTVWDERILGEVSLSRARKRAVRQRRTAALDPSRRNDRATSPSEASTLTRWRFQLGGISLVMQEEILDTRRNERLCSRISIGSMQFTQTLTLYREDDESGPRTRLGMKLVSQNSIAVIGELVPRLDVQKIVIEYVDSTLRQVQKHCEADA